MADADWRGLLARQRDTAMQAWVLSLYGEHLERMARWQDAQTAYQRSLALAPDGYTQLALAHLQLRQNQAAAALQTLQGAADTDMALILRAYALRLQKDPAWMTARDTLLTRQQATLARDSEAQAHAREFALLSLWLLDDPKTATAWAQRNLALQKEAIDWRIALAAAQRLSPQQQQTVQTQLKTSGLNLLEERAS